jgi:hypothetical protein
MNYRKQYAMMMKQPQININLQDEQTQHRTAVITLQDLLDYQAECYRDSTQQCYLPLIGLVDCEDCVLVDKPEYIEKTNVYTHTTPTFEGFIEFMKRRYK